MLRRWELSHQRLLMGASPRIGDTTRMRQRRTRPRHRPCKGEREVQPSRRLVELVFGPGSTRRAETPPPRIACTSVTAPSVRSRVCVSVCPSSSMARHRYRFPCFRRVTWSIFSSGFLFHRSKQLVIPSKKLCILSCCLSNLSSKSRYTSVSVVSQRIPSLILFDSGRLTC